MARRTKVTVRALHHYEKIGLLVPSARTDSGHRLYTRDDLARLQQIVSLRQLGLSLEEVAKALTDSRTTVGSVLELHLAEVRRQRRRAEDLERLLERFCARTRAGTELSIEELCQTLEAIAMYEKFFTPEQAERMRERAKQATPEALREHERQWKVLAARAKEAMERGDDPAGPGMQEVARAWKGLMEQITGGDAGLHEGLVKIYRADPDAAASRLGPNIDRRVLEYVGKALHAAKR